MFREFKDICELKSKYIESNSINQKKGIGHVFVNSNGHIKNIKYLDRKYNLTPTKKYFYPRMFGSLLGLKSFYIHDIQLNLTIKSLCDAEGFR